MSTNMSKTICFCSEFLAPGAHDPVNVDCKVAESVAKKVQNHPDRHCFDEAEVRFMPYYDLF